MRGLEAGSLLLRPRSGAGRGTASRKNRHVHVLVSLVCHGGNVTALRVWQRSRLLQVTPAAHFSNCHRAGHGLLCCRDGSVFFAWGVSPLVSQWAPWLYTAVTLVSPASVRRAPCQQSSEGYHQDWVFASYSRAWGSRHLLGKARTSCLQWQWQCHCHHSSKARS